MQFDHRPQQILCGGESLEHSYLPNSKISISLLNRRQSNRFPNSNNDYEDDKKGRWAKVDGKWCFVKDVSSSNSSSSNTSCDELTKAKITSKNKQQQELYPTKVEVQAPEPQSPLSSSSSSPGTNESPKVTRHTAAKQMQRIVRGFLQRRYFPVLVLQHKLDTMGQRTEESMAEIRREVEIRKEKYYNKMRLQARKELAAIDEEQALVFDAKQTINRLRAENKKLRKEAEELAEEMIALKAANENMEKVNDVVANTFAQLETEVANIHKAHDALQAAIPQYREAVDKLENEADLRQQYGSAEHGVKLRYKTVIGLIVDSMQNECKDARLVDEVVGYALEVDANSNSRSESKP